MMTRAEQDDNDDVAVLMMKMMLATVVVALNLYNISASRYFAIHLPNPLRLLC